MKVIRRKFLRKGIICLYCKMALFENKKGDIELDYVGKAILGAILLAILIFVVTMYIGGEFDTQVDRIRDVFRVF